MGGSNSLELTFSLNFFLTDEGIMDSDRVIQEMFSIFAFFGRDQEMYWKSLKFFFEIVKNLDGSADFNIKLKMFDQTKSDQNAQEQTIIIQTIKNFEFK